MTPTSGAGTTVINGSRRKRIARGSGTSVEEVNRLLKQFVQMRKMLKQLGAMQRRWQAEAARRCSGCCGSMRTVRTRATRGRGAACWQFG